MLDRKLCISRSRSLRSLACAKHSFSSDTSSNASHVVEELQLFNSVSLPELIALSSGRLTHGIETTFTPLTPPPCFGGWGVGRS